MFFEILTALASAILDPGFLGASGLWFLIGNMWDGLQGVGNRARNNGGFWGQFGAYDPSNPMGPTGSAGVDWTSLWQAAGLGEDGFNLSASGQGGQSSFRFGSGNNQFTGGVTPSGSTPGGSPGASPGANPGAANGLGGGAGNMGWTDWGTLALDAYGAYDSAQRGRNAANAANGPWSERTVNEPWGAAMPYLEGALTENQRVYQEAMRRYGGAAGGGGGGGRRGRRGGGGGGVAGYSDPVSGTTEEIAQRIRDRAMNGDPMMDRARGYVTDSLGAGEGGPFGGNEINNDLYNRLGGASFDRGSNLLQQFLGDSYGAGADSTGGAGGASRSGGGRGARGSRGGISAISRGGGGGGGGGGIMPDTMAGNSFFNTETRELFDDANLDPANDPTLAPYMEQIRREMGEDRDSQLAEIDDASNSIGMYGGSGRALEAARTREEAMEAYGGVAANTYMGARESALARRMQALGLVSERDIAAMNDQTDRYGIDASSASSAAGIASQEGIANRGMDLDAIRSMLQHDQFGLGMVGDLGESLSSDRQWATGAASNLRGQEMDDLGQAFGSWGTIDQSRASARESAANRQAQDAARRASQSRQDALAGQGMFSDYLRGLGIITGLGPNASTSTGRGQRGGGGGYSGPNPTSAALASAAGGAMAMYGSRNGGGGNGGGGGGSSQGYSLNRGGGTPNWWG